MNPEPVIPPHGGYRNLKSFQVAQLVYDLTVRFCDSYIDRRSRTHDQMVQAARSGVQNIAEGSLASATSKATEMKLTNVAKASLGELLRDYEDFLRQRGLPQWEKDDPRREDLFQQRCSTADEVAQWAARLHEGERSGLCGPGGPGGQQQPNAKSATYPEIAANAALLLITVAISLLDRQLIAQAETFEKEGGFRERLYRIRQQARRNSKDTPGP
ncbi:MAG: four helix bundle protein [Candidatus Hydrogenedentes bacterium]|nr:four helix bundle protein [Candidatus Hydrogenedentota bacterium]